MHLQPLPLLPYPAKNRLYHLLGSLLILHHRHGIGIKVPEPIGKYLFKCLHALISQQTSLIEFVPFQIACLNFP
jgi:hypothetical protein